MYITRIVRLFIDHQRDHEEFEGKELKILIQKGLITRTYHEHRAWCRRWEARRGLYCWLYTWKLYWARRVWFASAANYSRSLFRSRLSSSSWTLKQARSNVCSDMRFYIEFLQGTTRGRLFGNDFEYESEYEDECGIWERGFVILRVSNVTRFQIFDFIYNFIINSSQIIQFYYLHTFSMKFQFSFFLWNLKKLEKSSLSQFRLSQESRFLYI